MKRNYLIVLFPLTSNEFLLIIKLLYFSFFNYLIDNYMLEMTGICTVAFAELLFQGFITQLCCNFWSAFMTVNSRGQPYEMWSTALLSVMNLLQFSFIECYACILEVIVWQKSLYGIIILPLILISPKLAVNSNTGDF